MNTCTNCNSCNCTCQSSCNQQVDPCNTKCGCPFELSSQCIRYFGPDVNAVSMTSGRDFEYFVQQVDSAILNSKGNDGQPGKDGQGIDHIKFTSTTGTAQGQPGKVDTYTVYGDSQETVTLGTFTVTNGNDGKSIVSATFTGTTGTAQGQAGQTDTYTLWSGPGNTNAVGTFTVKNGDNGKRIVGAYNNLTGASPSASNSDVEDLFTVPLVANFISTDNNEIELYTYFEYLANDQVNLEFQLSPTQKYTLGVRHNENQVYIIKMNIARVSQTSQFWTIEIMRQQTGTTITSTTIDTHTTSHDLSVSTNFKITGNNIAFGANQVKIKKAVLYQNRIN